MARPKVEPLLRTVRVSISLPFYLLEEVDKVAEHFSKQSEKAGAGPINRSQFLSSMIQSTFSNEASLNVLKGAIGLLETELDLDGKTPKLAKLNSKVSKALKEKGKKK